MTPTPALLQNPALRSSLRSAATAFLISRGFVLAAVLAAPLLLVQEVSPDLVPPPYHTPAFWVVDALARWDAWRYLSVASIGYREGYLGANPQIFPLYPALMRLLGGLVWRCRACLCRLLHRQRGLLRCTNAAPSPGAGALRQGGCG